MIAPALALLAAWLLAALPARAGDDCAQLEDGRPRVAAGLRTTLVCHRGYAALHDDDARVPRWVAYRLTGRHTLGCLARANNFHADGTLRKGERATPADYRGSGYDMGHQAPAQDFAWSAGQMADSFSLANMAPQKAGLNRAQWLRLEETVRAWAWSRGELAIYVGPVLDDKPKHIGKSKVAVPRAFWKVVADPATGEALAFALPQRAIAKGPLEPWQVSVAAVERDAQLQLPLADDVARAATPRLWPADRRGWNKAHKAACH